mmetsp:Transcript_21102/g.25959  ORF Transcript_21102/g.25959 Transcript_21102/m.25959 type:complete len:138 (+) Transcript_21102:552-965(+)
MRDEMRKFLKDFDGYGYNKISCEEHFTEYATRQSDSISFVALRLADVIGPYDESWRFWKYCTWIKAHLGLPTRVTRELEAGLRAKKLWYEVPKDVEKKLSFTFSVDVVKFILASLDSTSGSMWGAETFTAINLACPE